MSDDDHGLPGLLLSSHLVRCSRRLDSPILQSCCSRNNEGNNNNDNDRARRTSIERKSRRDDHGSSDPEQKIMQIDKLMRDLLVRMDALDKGLARQRKQQHNNHGRERIL